MYRNRLALGFVWAGLAIGALSANAQNIPAKSTPSSSAKRGSAPVIEPRAMALLKHNLQVMLALKTYQAECRTTGTRDKPLPNHPRSGYELATLRAAKPNKMRYDVWNLKTEPATNNWAKPDKAPNYTFACDGKIKYQQFGSVYRKDSKTKAKQLHTMLEPWHGFFAADDSAYGLAQEYQKSKELREAQVTGSETVNGVRCDKVYLVVQSSYGGESYHEQAIWYIGPDGLVRRCVSHTSFGDKPGQTRDASLFAIRTNAPIAESVYAYTPPSGVTQEKSDETQPALLANGTIAPDFSALDSDGKTVKLSDYRGKVVVLDFWASWCGPCVASMPHNQRVAKKLQSEGLPVVLLAVDDGEERDAFTAYVKAHRPELLAIAFAHVAESNAISGKLFNVSGIPTQYVIDKDGVIRASLVGYGGETDVLEKSVRAALAGKVTPR